MSDFTTRTNVEYVKLAYKNNERRCPACLSSDVDSESVELGDNGTCLRTCWCLEDECDCTWNERYLLSDIENATEEEQ